MSKYEITVNDKTYEVEIVRDDGKTAVLKVNGNEYTVQARNVTVGATQARNLSSQSPSYSSPQAPSPQPPAPPPNTVKATSDAEGEYTLRAPMPGVVLEISVQVGDEVSSGDVVMRLEAMKMENDIKSHVNGRVSEIIVSKGQEVQEHDPLMVLVE